MTNESKDLAMAGAGGGAFAILTTATLGGGGGGACAANDESLVIKTFFPTAAVAEMDCITAVSFLIGGTPWSKFIGGEMSLLLSKGQASF